LPVSPAGKGLPGDETRAAGAPPVHCRGALAGGLSRLRIYGKSDGDFRISGQLTGPPHLSLSNTSGSFLKIYFFKLIFSTFLAYKYSLVGQ
jgi:hypothetical protein